MAGQGWPDVRRTEMQDLTHTRCGGLVCAHPARLCWDSASDPDHSALCWTASRWQQHAHVLKSRAVTPSAASSLFPSSALSHSLHFLNWKLPFQPQIKMLSEGQPVQRAEAAFIYPAMIFRKQAARGTRHQAARLTWVTAQHVSAAGIRDDSVFGLSHVNNHNQGQDQSTGKSIKPTSMIKTGPRINHKHWRCPPGWLAPSCRRLEATPEAALGCEALLCVSDEEDGLCAEPAGLLRSSTAGAACTGRHKVRCTQVLHVKGLLGRNGSVFILPRPLGLTWLWYTKQEKTPSCGV